VYCADFEYEGIIVNQIRKSYLPNTLAFLAVTFWSHTHRILLGGFGVRVGFGAVLISIHSNFAKEKVFILELPLKR
jgi:hypothetical protein